MAHEYLHKNKEGFYVRQNDIFFSKRNCPLITQNLFGVNKLITVERYCKWYSLYLIDPMAHTERNEPIVIPIPDDKILTWKTVDAVCPFYGLTADHSFYPVDVVDIAIHLGAKMELQVYDAICRRFLQDVHETDNCFTKEFFMQVNSRRAFNRNPEVMDDLMYGVDYGAFPVDDKLKKVILDDDQQLIN